MFQRSPLRLFLVCALVAISGRSHALTLPTPGTVTPETVKAPTGPSSVRGLAEMPEVAQSLLLPKESIPVPLPSGHAGLGPELDLTYDGSAGNSTLGSGWSITVPVVRRSLRHGVPDYSQALGEFEYSDRTISGRLIQIATGEWRLEGKGNEYRVVTLASGFRVDYPDGRSAKFGMSPQTRTEDGSRIAEWWIDSETDVVGQTILYSYLKPYARPLLAQIKWGPGSLFDLLLSYEDRPDVHSSYATGWLVTTGQRLHSIALTCGPVERYKLTFGYDSSLSVSRLVTIDKTGFQGRGNDPRSTFSYVLPPDVAKPQAMTVLAGWVLNQGGANLLDINGDGLVDLFTATDSSHAFRRNLGNGKFAQLIALATPPNAALGRMRLMDTDGDSRPELITVVDGQWVERTLTNLDPRSVAWGAPVVVAGSRDVPLISANTSFADINGDGRTDVLEASGSGLTVRYMTASGLSQPLHMPRISLGNPAVVPGDAGTQILDVNGDGNADVLWLGDDHYEVYLGVGDGTFVPQTHLAYPWAGVLSDRRSLLIADFDRDGFVDFARVTAGDVSYYRAISAFEFAPRVMFQRPESVDYDAVVALGDANGNGTTDVVWSSPRGLWLLDLAGSGAVGLLASYDNGVGAVTRFEYTSTGQALSSAAVPWSRVVPTSVAFVSRAVTSTGSDDPPRVVGYEPRNPYWDTDERKLGGYEVVTETDGGGTAPMLRQTFTYEIGDADNYVLRGRLRTRVRSNGAGGLYDSIQYTNQALVLARGAPGRLGRVPFVVREQLKVYELGATSIGTSTDYVPDEQGRIASTYEAGRADTTGDERSTVKTYADSTAPWVRGFCVSETVTRNGKIERSVRHYASDGQKELPLGSVGLGWPQRTESWLNDTSAGRWITSEELTHDSWGTVISHTVDGVRRSFGLDPLGLTIVAESLNDGSHTFGWTAHWDPDRGVLDKISGIDGSSLVLRYDDLARILSVERDGHVAHIRYSYSWDGHGTRTTTEEYDGVGEPPIDGTWSEGSGWTFDTKVRDGLGNEIFSAQRLTGSRWIVNSRVRRDALGNVAHTYEAYYRDDFNLGQPPATTAVTDKLFDGLGRVTSEAFANGEIRKYVRSPFAEKVESTGLATVSLGRDGLGRITENRRRLDVSGGDELVTTAEYDTGDRLVSMSSPLGGSATFIYDSLGRMIRSQDPDAGVRTYIYNDFGRLVRATNSAANVVNYSYDALGRPLLVADESNVSYRYHYDYNRDGSQTNHVAGRVAWIEEPTGITKFGYDQQGNVIVVERAISNNVLIERKRFSLSGLLLTTSWDGGPTVEYKYDSAGRLIQIGDLAQIKQLDPSGRVLQESFGDGTTNAYSYDQVGLPRSVKVGSSAKQLMDRFAEREPYGAIRTITDNLLQSTPAGSATFGHDALGRLRMSTWHGPDLTASYDYDALDNMTARVHGAEGSLSGLYRYEKGQVAPRQLTSVTRPNQPDVSLTYDGAGRTIAIGNESLKYDGFDHLVGVSTPTSHATYSYGYDGLVVQSSSGTQSSYQWTLSALQRGGVRQYYVSDGDRLIARLSQGPNGSAVQLYFHREFGAGPVLLTDGAGRVVELRRFDAFGNPSTSGTGGGVDLNSEPRDSLNKDTDVGTGFVYHGNRWLVPSLARWLTPDEDARGAHPDKMLSPWLANPYTFVGDSPTHLWDPSGKFANIIGGAAVGGTIGLGVYVVNTLNSRSEFSGRSAIAATFSGALSGMIASCGPAGWAASGLVGGITSRAIETGSVERSLDPSAMKTDAVMGVALGAAGIGLSRLAKPIANSILGYNAIGGTGRVGERILSRMGGESQKGFLTSRGWRFVDQFVDNVAHESKVGYVSLTKSIESQLMKDAELLLDKRVSEVVWHIFESPVTGVAKASKPFLELAADLGIKVVVH